MSEWIDLLRTNWQVLLVLIAVIAWEFWRWRVRQSVEPAELDAAGRQAILTRLRELQRTAATQPRRARRQLLALNRMMDASFAVGGPHYDDLLNTARKVFTVAGRWRIEPSSSVRVVDFSAGRMDETEPATIADWFKAAHRTNRTYLLLVDGNRRNPLDEVMALQAMESDPRTVMTRMGHLGNPYYLVRRSFLIEAEANIDGKHEKPAELIEYMTRTGKRMAVPNY